MLLLFKPHLIRDTTHPECPGGLHMLLLSLIVLPSLHCCLVLPQIFNSSFALTSSSLLAQIHRETCLNLPRTLGHIYWKVAQLNLGIERSWGRFRLFGPEFIDDLNYQSITLMIYDSKRLAIWFIPCLSPHTVSYILQGQSQDFQGQGHLWSHHHPYHCE